MPLSVPPQRARATSASAVYCCHSRVLPACLSSARCGLAMFQMACSKAAPCSSGRRPLSDELAPAVRPGHAQRATLVQRLVVVHRRRSERARGQRDRTGRLAERHARELRIALGSRELGGGCDLVEGQRPGAERVIEGGQVAQRIAGVRDALRGAVVAARDLRQPLRAGGAPRRAPILLVVGLAHDLREPLRETRLLLADRTHLATAPLAPPLQHLIGRPFQCGEHMFVPYQASHPASVPSLCRNPALFSCQATATAGRPRGRRPPSRSAGAPAAPCRSSG